MRLLRILIVSLAAAMVLPLSQASAAELLMYRRDGCPYCAAWDREVGPGYNNSNFGKIAPVRMVDVHGARPQVALKSPIIYTPTFVLIDDGREVGRVEGYASNDFFYGTIARLIGQLPPSARGDLSASH
ncbi:MAG: thioredoxin family protein [Pseudomonadota bacterium]